LFSSFFFLVVALLIIAIPLYNPAVLIMVSLLAIPTVGVINLCMFNLAHAMMVSAVDALVEADDRSTAESKEKEEEEKKKKKEVQKEKARERKGTWARKRICRIRQGE
jgi:membrane protein implicated in regulation of membrane protease activity